MKMTKVPEREQRELQRTRYVQGQMLRSADFRSQVRTESQLRWWHNRALHNAYGVALGFEASKAGKDSSSFVRLEPGVAYDSFGRALILTKPRNIPLPNPNLPGKSFTLLARYRETCEYPDPRLASAIGLSSCAAPLEEEAPEFLWKPTETLTLDDGVPIGRLVRKSESVKSVYRLDPVFTAATSRPLSRPYLAQGFTLPGSTAWSAWRIDGEQTIGIETVVDTSAAGFTRVPCYFANVDGLEITNPNQLLIAHIQDAAANSFRFQLLVSAAFFRRAQPIPLYVRWLGCQSTADANQCLSTAGTKPCCR
jgi:hypothetical protein